MATTGLVMSATKAALGTATPQQHGVNQGYVTGWFAEQPNGWCVGRMLAQPGIQVCLHLVIALNWRGPNGHVKQISRHLDAAAQLAKHCTASSSNS
jgi:hypothetical protein